MSEFGPKPGQHADDCAYTVHKWTCSCDYPKYLTAVENIARQIISDIVGDSLYDLDWSEWPDLPEFVWQDVRDRVSELSQPDAYVDVDRDSKALSALATEDA